MCVYCDYVYTYMYVAYASSTATYTYMYIHDYVDKTVPLLLYCLTAVKCDRMEMFWCILHMCACIHTCTCGITLCSVGCSM